ncbi:hypothetical protein SteCoe_29948 [Stentor coeruleus]|uniref:Uncharacterized protein n=1 Tax=Stentor coeruleus TaxID=5963 RepID=A0A1R2B4N9_9CILI|nr:hypothetical protein SteCoe_29948 [Stentor coeruleus]
MKRAAMSDLEWSKGLRTGKIITKTFKLVKPSFTEREGSSNHSIAVTEKILECNEEFEKTRQKFLKAIESNNKVLENKIKRNKELKFELENLGKLGMSKPPTSPRTSIQPAKQNDVMDYYKQKLNELESLVEQQNKDYMKAIRKVEAEINNLKKELNKTEENPFSNT